MDGWVWGTNVLAVLERGILYVYGGSVRGTLVGDV
jgi:hypothetical protein